MTLYADKRAIKQILINLLSNAVKFTGKDGRVRVNARDQKFASDVIHQRQMEFLLRAGAPSFRIAQGRIQVGGRDDWMPDDIDLALRFLHGFFGRVPDFVWQGLGAWPRPIAEIEPPAR